MLAVPLSRATSEPADPPLTSFGWPLIRSANTAGALCRLSAVQSLFVCAQKPHLEVKRVGPRHWRRWLDDCTPRETAKRESPVSPPSLIDRRIYRPTEGIMCSYRADKTTENSYKNLIENENMGLAALSDLKEKRYYHFGCFHFYSFLFRIRPTTST